MAGLLEPRGQGLLALAAGLMSPTLGGSFGGALGQGLQGYQQAYGSAQRLANEQDRLGLMREKYAFEMEGAKEARAKQKKLDDLMAKALGFGQPMTQQQVEQAYAQRQAGNRAELGLPDGGWGAQASPVAPPRVQTGPADMPRQGPIVDQQAFRQAAMIDPQYAAQIQALVMPKAREVMNVNGKIIDKADPSKVLADYSTPEMTPIEKTLTAAGIQRGSPEWNRAMQGAVMKATSHPAAANVNVAPTVNVEADKSLSRQVGEIMTSERTKLSGAVNLAQSAGRMLNAINSGDVIVGPTADTRLYLAKIGNMLGVGGKDTADTITRTRRVIRELADAAVEARQLVSGQGQITESEGAAVAKARSGEYDDLTIEEIRAIAELNIKAAHLMNKGYSESFNALPDDLKPFYKVQGADSLPAIPAPLGDIKETDFDRAMRKYGQ